MGTMRAVSSQNAGPSVRRSASSSRAARRVGRAGALGARASMATGKKSVLIVNTPGGGHAVLGYSLAKKLSAEGHAVSVVVPCEETSSKMLKPPFTLFGDLTDMGVSCYWSADGVGAPELADAKFDVVLDNNGKDIESVGPSIEFARASSEQFVFISSAGMYKASPGGQAGKPYVEGDPVKESAGHNKVEEMLRESEDSLKWSSFRPQYMTGYGQNKDCEEYFLDRLVRGRPVCVPGDGTQITSVTPVEDLTDMLAAAVGNPASYNKLFNCVGERTVTLDGMVELCAKTAGVEAKIVHYDPDAIGVEVKKAFPFRPVDSYAEPKAAKELLGWAPKVDLEKALAERYEFYTTSGRAGKEMTFELDDQIIEKVSENVN